MVVGLGFVLLFLFVPETFWDRTPHRRPSRRPSFLRRLSSRRNVAQAATAPGADASKRPSSPGLAGRSTNLHVGFAPAATPSRSAQEPVDVQTPTSVHSPSRHIGWAQGPGESEAGTGGSPPPALDTNIPITQLPDDDADVMHSPPLGQAASPRGGEAALPRPHSLRSPSYRSAAGSAANVDYSFGSPNLDTERIASSRLRAPPKIQAYTHNLRQLPAQTFSQQLKVYHGRLNNDNWFKVMARPFVLFAYPAVLWSSAVYACSIGWLIVISETMAIIYRDPTIYNFSALQTGLVYISPFVGGILGTGVAGKVSDVVVRIMSRRNGGLYEPEFRLVMALPMLISTGIGLMGFGWSAQERDPWIVPTVFFGVLSFGCSLGSTTAITYCVDSYRQYAGEALVTLNFSKNIFHGLVFSLFVAHWMASDGPKRVYIWLGVIQVIVLLSTIPLYIYGKRARMWTVRRNLMEKL